MTMPARSDSAVIIIGGGFGGLAMACQLKRLYNLDNYVIYDRHEEIGGTWVANTYPGSAVDIPAICYSLSFAPNPNFTELFPRQSEILKYIQDVADRYDVNRHFVGHTEWKGAKWQEHSKTWIVALQNTKTKQQFTRECQILVSAVGGLVNPNTPTIQGMESFQGHVMHTATWNDDVDLAYKSVAVIGNGASAAQLIPAIAGKPKRITQFMRTPHHLVPSRNFTISPTWRVAFRKIPGLLYLFRTLMFLYLEMTLFYFRTTRSGQKKRMQAAKQSIDHVRNTAPEKYWAMLTPAYEFGCRRRVFDQSYTATLRRQDVRLINDPIAAIGPKSIRTESGEDIPVDVIILATGFSLSQYDTELRGRQNKTRAEHWSELGSKSTFNSVAMHDFPNFFYVLGPNSGRLHTSTLYSIESHVDLITSVIKPILRGRAACVEVKANSEKQYTEDLHAALDKTVHNDSCSSFLIDKQTGKNWFVYPWDSLRMWLSTHWISATDWEYEASVQ